MRLFDSFPPRVLAPNLITASGMVLGFVSVASSAAGAYGRAAWLIALAALVDKLDGSVARALRASSEFGVQFDSFSDFCTFGLAPAALVYFATPTLAGPAWAGAADVGCPRGALLFGICAAYAVFAAVRLARFNVNTEEHPTMFQGLPSTLSGSLVGLCFLTAHELGVATADVLALFPWLLVLNATLMVSNLPLPKLKLPAGLPGRIFFIANAAAIYVLVPMQVAFWYALTVLLGYVSIGFVLGLRAERGSVA
ncbi:MAG: hypothetical protein RIT45_1846 [Pseudomonadota bacterium]|jgi:CDP-diacylglycerol--serine O-phosphatidyltransferase